ncbi:hypothetical protein WN48_11183 [Eufriesea mexicana]|uniref:Uncharacterized protein n=2 Tax=Eufriesea mexicana TaxID=516756 RepID=A0A310S5X2_9HYME|nr:hypothetical protein WN48_11183 [Eufriesea mexicana]
MRRPNMPMWQGERRSGHKARQGKARQGKQAGTSRQDLPLLFLELHSQNCAGRAEPKPKYHRYSFSAMVFVCATNQLFPTDVQPACTGVGRRRTNLTDTTTTTTTMMMMMTTTTGTTETKV